MDIFQLPLEQLIPLVFLFCGFLAFITFLFIAAIKILKPKEITKDGVKWENGNSEKPESSSILHHRLFKFFESCESPGALSLDGESDKSILCENYLKLKFKTLHDGYYDFFKNLERHDFDGLSKLPNEVNEWVNQYELKASKMITHTSKGDICGIPKCFNQKFSKWHKRHATQLFDDYDNALSDRQYENNRERALVMLTATFFALRETIQDARYTLDNLNGDLDRELDEMIKESCKED